SSVKYFSAICLFKGELYAEPLYFWQATFGMLLGIGVAKFYASRHSSKSKIALAAMFTRIFSFVRLQFSRNSKNNSRYE
ncbi:MAG: hypothetical protein ACP5JW_07080, partial [Candidatus Bathyarchaeia archaeon]